MKITQDKIKQIIREELSRALTETRVVEFRGDGYGDVHTAYMNGAPSSSIDEENPGPGPIHTYYKWISDTAKSSGAPFASFDDDGMTSSSWISSVGAEAASEELIASGVPHPDGPGNQWTAHEVETLIDVPVPVDWLVSWLEPATKIQD